LSNIRGDIRKSRCTGSKFAAGIVANGVNNTVGKIATALAANFATSFAIVVDTGGKFVTGVIDIEGTISAC
jgi:hypothetical protein